MLNVKCMSKSQIAFEMMYRLTAPTIVWPGYEDFLPEHLKEKVRLARLVQVLPATTATDEEAMVYLHTASLAVPFSREWFNIYSHLFCKCFPEQAKVIGNDVKELDTTEKMELEGLKAWIFQRQRTTVKAKLNSNKEGEYADIQSRLGGEENRTCSRSREGGR